MLLLALSGLLLAGVSPASHTAAAMPAAAEQSEQPQSWLLKYKGPAPAGLRGTEVLHRQPEAAVAVVRPAEPGADVQQWLARLQSEPGVEYVHPNSGVHMLAMPSAEAEGEPGEAAADGSVAESGAQPPADDTTRQSVKSGAANEAGDADSRQQDAAVTPSPADDEALAGGGAAEEETQRVSALAAEPTKADDPELGKQTYLTQIGAQKAWETVRSQTERIIAIVDTGIDLDHPDLKGNLVPGTNLVKKGAPPDDDNGHGTSVAGVIGAAGNNGRGVAGILWNAKLMPIKALDENGDGTEQELGEAILYAVKNGASIVVLSVGLHRYSPYMQDIVQYAESKGVLLVAAAGNDGERFKEKAAVKYPAAYPTVLAVGGVRANGTMDPRSNPGSELDVVAPWNVFTTAMGGLYKKEEGTSMAAPQAAAAAALVWAQNPDFKPYQIRELLRQTAKDIGAPGVDPKSGYGVLQVDKAIAASLKADAFEPNESMRAAAVFPLFTQITAALDGASDQDWYTIEVPFDGTLTLSYEGLVSSGTVPPIRTSHYAGGKLQASVDTKLASGTIDLKVKKGKQTIKLALANQTDSRMLPYKLTSTFAMNPDEYERNDKAYEAFTLPPRTQSITGSFHQKGDQDWFVVTFQQGGKLNLSVSVSTARIDPALAVQKAGQSLQLFDEASEGETEQSPVITVTPGKYYIRVHNAISSEASPTIGTYKLDIDYTPVYEDPNEPNDKSYEAFMVKPGTEYLGVVDSYSDVDWFQHRVTGESLVSITVTGVPANRDVKLIVYDKKMKQLASASTGNSGKLQTAELLLKPDIYYVKLTSNAPFDQQYYRLRMNADLLIGGFRDLAGHWAADQIVDLNKRGIVNGTGGYRFEPKRAITRAEAVAMVVKAYNPIGGPLAATSGFKDLPTGHWASNAVRTAVQQGWVSGFPDGTFKPSQPVTREEMAMIIGKAEGVQPRLPLLPPFADVDHSDWSAPMLYALKLQGLIEGMDGGVYKPKQSASRADFSALLHRVLK